MWMVLSVIAIISLFVFFARGPNAVWGSATIGLIIGVVVATIRNGFEWTTIGKGVVIGTVVGLIAEIPHILKSTKFYSVKKIDDESQIKILIIDDESNIRQTVLDRFEIVGYDSCAVTDNDSALELIQKNRYDLIIQNMNRPLGKCLENDEGEFSGVLFYKKYIVPLHPKIPVIFYSAHANRIPNEILSDFCIAVNQPFDLSELVELIEFTVRKNQ